MGSNYGGYTIMRWFKEGMLALTRPKPMLTIYEDPEGMQAEPELIRMDHYSSKDIVASVTLFKSPMCFIVEIFGVRVTFWEFFRTEEEGKAAFKAYCLIINRAAATGRVAF
jgi:hypothetical protein